MDNKVGDKLLAPELLATILGQLRGVVDTLKAHGITLSTDDRRRSLRPRIGAEVHMQHVFDLATKHGVSLKTIPLEGMSADLTLGKQMQPLEDQLRLALQIAEDTGTQASSEAWEAFLAYYGILSSMADRIPELAVELEEVVTFMSLGPRRKGPVTPA